MKYPCLTYFPHPKFLKFIFLMVSFIKYYIVKEVLGSLTSKPSIPPSSFAFPQDSSYSFSLALSFTESYSTTYIPRSCTSSLNLRADFAMSEQDHVVSYSHMSKQFHIEHSFWLKCSEIFARLHILRSDYV